MRIWRHRVGSVMISAGKSGATCFASVSVTSLSRWPAFMLTMFHAGSTMAATCGEVRAQPRRGFFRGGES